MNEEAALLAAIRDDPRDVASRLVYADWLDDHQDWRAELVRIEEEMRRLPVYSDRYLLLTPRRDDLRSRAESSWLEALRYGTDCVPVFAHGVPRGWLERWRLIREFCRWWYRVPLGDVGGSVEAVREIEDRLQLTLPPSFREWIAFVHEFTQLTSEDSDFYPNELLPSLRQIRRLQGRPAVSLFVPDHPDEYYCWVVPCEHFHLPDPPVYFQEWDPDHRNGNFFERDENTPIADALTSLVLEQVIRYPRSLGERSSRFVHDPAALIQKLTAAFPVHLTIGSTQVFEAENLLVCLRPVGWETLVELVVQTWKPLPDEAIPTCLRHNAQASDAPPHVAADDGGDVPF